jgi:hypothetical protein
LPLDPDRIRRNMATLYEIVCLLFPGGARPISILVESTKTVGALANKVWESSQKTAGRFDLWELKLYKVDVPGEIETIRVQGVQAKAIVIKMEEEPLDYRMELGTLYPSSPPEEAIHILVLLPSEGESVKTVHRMRGVSVSRSGVLALGDHNFL